MDRPLIMIFLLLLGTLTAWRAEWFVYPFGILVIFAALLARLLRLATRERG